MGRAFVTGAYKERPIAKSFSEATWEEIINACEKNLIPDNWNVGDQNTMLINGTTYIIDIIGKNHDEYADRSGIAPLTFQLHDCYGTTYKMRGSSTNVGGWDATNVYSTYLPQILTLMPAEVKSGIKEIRKVTSIGNASSSLESSSNKLFLLSEAEVFAKLYQSFSGEGTRYAYYTNGGSPQKSAAGTAVRWWLRSPNKGDSTNYATVSASGGQGSAGATGTYYLSFAFCF